MDPILAQIILWPGSWIPQGWLACNGQLIPISQNAALFSLLGTTYGGDGKTTFGLPNLNGRVPVGVGQISGGSNVYALGLIGGSESSQLSLPVSVGTVGVTVQPNGGGSTIDNRQPFMGMYYIIAVEGVYPSRS